MATIRPRSLPLRWCGRGRSVLGTGPSPSGCRVRVVAAAAGDAVADGWCRTLGLKSDGVPECGCRVRDADCEREVVLERDELALTADESERAALWELDDRLLLTSERELLSCAATHLAKIATGSEPKTTCGQDGGCSPYEHAKDAYHENHGAHVQKAYGGRRRAGSGRRL